MICEHWRGGCPARAGIGPKRTAGRPADRGLPRASGDRPHEAVNHLATLGDRTAGAGAGLGVFGWLLSSQFIGLAGLVVALIGVLISWHYKREANRRHVAEHALRMERLRRGQRVDTDLSELEADE